MSTNFECFIDLNGEKLHSIIVNKDINSVTFGDIYNEIIKIESKQNVSFEKNTFEIFDLELNEYQKIINLEQIIKYLTRIRVVPKIQNNNNNNDRELVVLRDDYKDSKHNKTNNDNNNKTFNNDLNKNTVKKKRNRRERREKYFNRQNKYPYVERGFDYNYNPDMNTSHGNQNFRFQSSQPYYSDGFYPPIYPPFDESFNPNPYQTEPFYRPVVIDHSFNDSFETQDMYRHNNNSFERHFEPQTRFRPNDNSYYDEFDRHFEPQNRYNPYYPSNSNQFPPQKRTHFKTNRTKTQKIYENFKGIDKSFVIPIENLKDINIFRARKEALIKIDQKLKEKFIAHGIKLMNGIGSNAYACHECNLLFKSLSDAEKHLEKFDKTEDLPVINSVNDESLLDSAKKQLELLEEQKEVKKQEIKSRLEKEGIKQISNESEDDKSDEYFCVFCDLQLNNEKIAIDHMKRAFHEKTKQLKLNLNPIDDNFTTDSERMAEPDVSLARMNALKVLNNEIKTIYKDEGIRLKDGIGSDAYVCLICELSIHSETVESGMLSFISHSNSPKHIESLILHEQNCVNQIQD